MSILAVIGGPSRSGKTTLARRLKETREFRAFNVFDLDAFKMTLQATCGVAEADLATPDEIAESKLTEIGRDALVFERAVPYIRRMLDKGYDVLADGRFRPSFDYGAFSPHHVREVYLLRSVRDIDDEARLLAHIERSDPDGGWLASKGWDLRQFAERHAASVRSWKDETEACGKKCFDASDDRYGQAGGFSLYMLEATAYMRTGCKDAHPFGGRFDQESPGGCARHDGGRWKVVDGKFVRSDLVDGRN